MVSPFLKGCKYVLFITVWYHQPAQNDTFENTTAEDVEYQYPGPPTFYSTRTVFLEESMELIRLARKSQKVFPLFDFEPKHLKILLKTHLTTIKSSKPLPPKNTTLLTTLPLSISLCGHLRGYRMVI